MQIHNNIADYKYNKNLISSNKVSFGSDNQSVIEQKHQYGETFLQRLNRMFDCWSVRGGKKHILNFDGGEKIEKFDFKKRLRECIFKYQDGEKNISIFDKNRKVLERIFNTSTIEWREKVIEKCCRNGTGSILIQKINNKIISRIRK